MAKRKRIYEIDNLGFRKGMKVKVQPFIAVDPAGFKGKEVKILKVRDEVAVVKLGKKIGYYDVDTLIKSKKR